MAAPLPHRDGVALVKMGPLGAPEEFYTVFHCGVMFGEFKSFAEAQGEFLRARAGADVCQRAVQ